MIWPRRAVIGALGACLTSACRSPDPQLTRLSTRPALPTRSLPSGAHPLDLGRVSYRGKRRDGMLYVPRVAISGSSVPLLIMLHGGGGQARDFDFMFPIADACGTALLTLDARHNTWDGVDSPFGPDVRFIDEALRHTFAHVRIDPSRLALGGLSDGGMYALTIGLINGDLFTHLAAVAPGYVQQPAPAVGRPRILLAHGTRDRVYSVTGSRTRILPLLREAGYDVSYHEFDGPHFITPAAARYILDWLAGTPPPSP